MKTSNQIVCVLRLIAADRHEWVAASGRTDLVANEPTMIGYFDSFEVGVGPSRSHVITCYQPLGRSGRSTLDINEFLPAPTVAASLPAVNHTREVTCVLRLVGRKEEFVLAEGRNDLEAGEPLSSGRAFASYVNSGPSNSHRVTVWNFTGAIERSTVPTAPQPNESPLDTTILVVAAGAFLGGNGGFGQRASA